jgi:hypothetical protein
LSAGRILVIDDEPQIRRLMRTTLIGSGYEVEDAKSAFLTGFRREAAQTGMDTRRIWRFPASATGGFRRRTQQYVEESDRAQRS